MNDIPESNSTEYSSSRLVNNAIQLIYEDLLKRGDYTYAAELAQILYKAGIQSFRVKVIRTLRLEFESHLEGDRVELALSSAEDCLDYDHELGRLMLIRAEALLRERPVQNISETLVSATLRRVCQRLSHHSRDISRLN